MIKYLPLVGLVFVFFFLLNGSSYAACPYSDPTYGGSESSCTSLCTSMCGTNPQVYYSPQHYEGSLLVPAVCTCNTAPDPGTGGGGSNPGCTNSNQCPGCQSCNFYLIGGVETGVCEDNNGFCAANQYCSDRICYDNAAPPSGGGGSAPPPAPTPTPTTAPTCSSVCASYGLSCGGSCGSGYCCGSDVCNGSGGCCPGSAPYFYDGGCHSSPSSPPPSGGSCTQPYCTFGNRLTYCDGSYTTCANGCTGSAGSASCISDSGSTPPPSSGGSCGDGQPAFVDFCCGNQLCVKTSSGGTPVCDPPTAGVCGVASGGGSAPPPSSGGGCTGSGQIVCGGSCWSSTCTGTLSCGPSGGPVCTPPPVTCGSGSVSCGGSCVGVGGSCPGGWQCVDGSVTCPSGWVAPAPDGQFYGTVFIDTNGNGVQNAGESGYSSGWVRRYAAQYNSSSCNTTACAACSPDYPDHCGGAIGTGSIKITDSTGNYYWDTIGFEMATIYFAAPSGYTSTTPTSVLVSTDSSITPGFGRRANFGIRPNTFTVTSNVRVVSDTSSCISSSGNAYAGANLNLQGGTTNLTQATNASGVTVFNAPPQSYTLSLGVPSGYSVVGRAYPSGGSASGTSGMTFTLSANTSATFCIAATNPWFQTDTGDVRFSALSIPVPSGKYASTGNQSSQYPGIYYSSNTAANTGSGTVSSVGWLVSNEYSYNANTQNRNGTISYSFYKSRAKTEGVAIHQLTAGTLNQNEITESGVYEAAGDLAINSYTHTSGRRVVILASGDITINTPISISTGQGFLIVAAKGDLTVSATVGTTTLSSTSTSLDGYYSAEGSVVLPTAASCPSTPDKRLNIGGVLIANSLKPFATSGTGSIQNDRTLCNENLNYPTLYVSSRPDFLTQLTDFYKIPYTKWKEERP